MFQPLKGNDGRAAARTPDWSLTWIRFNSSKEMTAVLPDHKKTAVVNRNQFQPLKGNDGRAANAQTVVHGPQE